MKKYGKQYAEVWTKEPHGGAYHKVTEAVLLCVLWPAVAAASLTPCKIAGWTSASGLASPRVHEWLGEGRAWCAFHRAVKSICAPGDLEATDF